MNFNYILQVVGSFSDSDFVNWASEQKIIQDINQLHFCSSCYNLMKLCYSDRYPDGAIFKCINRTCRNTMSIRFNSWISDAKISLKQFTVILACWSEGLNIKSTSQLYQKEQLIIILLCSDQLQKKNTVQILININ